jgi:tetratricopeptide (TPR) repeat protein
LRAEVPESLISLARKELIAAADPAFSSEGAFRFIHALVHDAAYRGLLKRTRADLHEKFVDWLDAVSGERFAEHEEIRGYHLEQAFLALLDLGPADAHAVELGQRGSGYLATAGERARARGDMPAAAGLLRRAAALLPDGDGLRPHLLLHAGEALGEMGKLDEANTLLSQAADAAGRRDDRALTTTASVVRLMLRFMAEPESAGTSQVVDAAGEAIEELENLEAHAGLARAWRLMMYVHFMEGNFSAADTAARRAVVEAELAEDRVLEVRFLAALASCVVSSPTPVPEAIEQCNQILERSGADRRTDAITLGALSHLEAMRGNFDRARDLYTRSRTMLTELGFTLSASIVALQSGPVEVLAGDLARAEDELRSDFTALTALGNKGYMTSVAGMLAEVLHAQGRLGEAKSFAAVFREAAAPDDVAAQYQWHSIQAKLSAADGNLDEAEALAREALRLISTTDQPDIQGEAFVTLAFVLQAAGKAEAVGALGEAIALFEQKGNIVSAERARAALGSLAAASGAASEREIVA